MLGYQEEQRTLTVEHKKYISILSIGTFLEQFDLMLYVHMSILLNDLFFSQTNTHSMKMLSAFSFCSTFIFRPFGALLFGWIGDNIGRKSTMVITTFMMSCTCIVMAMLPTYAEIGITATVIITVCRAVQGISSLGEITAAEMYVTETIRPPIQYPAVAIMSVACALGSVVALSVDSLVTSTGFNWRYAFIFGAFVAVIGTMARTTLRETPEFVDAKRRVEANILKSEHGSQDHVREMKDSAIYKLSASWKTIFAYFAINCPWPVCFYFGYIYCGDMLHEQFHYTAAQVIRNNLLIAIIEVVAGIVLSYLSYKIYPLKVLKAMVISMVCFICAYPFIMHDISDTTIVLIQAFFVISAPSAFPASSIFFKHFPVLKRFTYASLVFAISRAVMYAVASFGITFLIDYFGHLGLLLILVPVVAFYYMGLRHFEHLEEGSMKERMA